MVLPLLDIRAFRSNPQRFAEELRHACHHYGFFQIRHGMPGSVVSRATALSREFFALPEEAKRRIDYTNSSAFRGYMANGVENTAGKPDLREQVEIAPEAPPAASDAWPPFHRLCGRNQWPDEALPELRPAIEDYAQCVGEVAREITEALCLALRLERDALSHFFEPEPHWQLKLAQYSPAQRADASSPPAPDVGVGAHTDSGWLTLLLQDGSGGLQAFTRGEWTDVPPAGDDVFVCNLGEVAEMLSAGYLLATPHRVLLPATPRMSIPYFFNPRLDSKVAPIELPPSLPWEREEGYEKRTHWRRPDNAMIKEYGSNAFKSLARSHPAVFATHHPDLAVLEDGRVVKREI